MTAAPEPSSAAPIQASVGAISRIRMSSGGGVLGTATTPSIIPLTRMSEYSANGRGPRPLRPPNRGGSPIVKPASARLASRPRAGGDHVQIRPVRIRLVGRSQHDDERLVPAAVFLAQVLIHVETRVECQFRREILRDQIGELRRRPAGAPPHASGHPHREARLDEQQQREQGDVAQRDPPVETAIPARVLRHLLYPRGFAPRTPRHALSRAASPARFHLRQGYGGPTEAASPRRRAVRVARSRCSLALPGPSVVSGGSTHRQTCTLCPRR
jgi:hypothetical protein